MKTAKITGWLAIALLAAGVATASEVGSVTTFTPNTEAKASEVNANFQALIAAINDNATRIAALEGAAADYSVAGKAYRVLIINNRVSVGDDDADGTQYDANGDFANTNIRAAEYALTLSANDNTGTFTTVKQDEYEISESEFSPTTDEDIGVVENITYAQNGNSLTVTFPDNSSISFTLGLGAAFFATTSAEHITDSDFNGGATGQGGDIELLIGIQVPNP